VTSPTPPQFGTIRLTDILASWSDQQPLNPRLLASELAGVLYAIAPQGHALETHIGGPHIYDPACGPGQITYHYLADYFSRVSRGEISEKIETSSGHIPAASVHLRRYWIDRLTTEALQRAGIAQALFVDVLSAPSSKDGDFALSFKRSDLTSYTEPAITDAQQRQHRERGEKVASERLDTAQQHIKCLEGQNARLKAENDQLTSQKELNRNDNISLQQALSEEKRVRILLEEQLAELLDENKYLAAEASQLKSENEALQTNCEAMYPALANLTKLFKPKAKNQSAELRAALLTVAGLLDILESQKANFSQGLTSDEIASKHWPGASKRNVDEVFAKANQAKKDATSEAIAKAADIQRHND